MFKELYMCWARRCESVIRYTTSGGRCVEKGWDVKTIKCNFNNGAVCNLPNWFKNFYGWKCDTSRTMVVPNKYNFGERLTMHNKHWNQIWIQEAGEHDDFNFDYQL